MARRASPPMVDEEMRAVGMQRRAEVGSARRIRRRNRASSPRSACSGVAEDHLQYLVLGKSGVIRGSVDGRLPAPD